MDSVCVIGGHGQLHRHVPEQERRAVPTSTMYMAFLCSEYGKFGIGSGVSSLHRMIGSVCLVCKGFAIRV